MKTKRLVVMLFVVAALAWIAVFQAPDGRLHIIFLDVDSGQGVIVRTPSGRYALIDGGARASVVLAALGRYMPFWQKTIGAAVATHQGNSAVLPLLEITGRYRLLAAVAPPRGDHPSAAYQSWCAALQQHNVALTEAQPETVLDLGDGVGLTITSSASERLGLLISYGNVSVSLPGRSTLSVLDRQAQVIALPTNQAGLAGFTGEGQTSALVLFTGAKDAKASAPAAVPGLQLFSTAVQGPIELVSDGASLTLHPVR